MSIPVILCLRRRSKSLLSYFAAERLLIMNRNAFDKWFNIIFGG